QMCIRDSVGLIGFTDQVEVFVPPRSGRKHVLSVIQRVLTHESENRGTSPVAALEYLARLHKGHSVAVLVSDFVDDMDDDAGARTRFEHALKVAKRRHDIIPIRVEDPIELALPPVGLLAVEDLELLGAGGDLFVDLSRSNTERFSKQVAAERDAFEALMRKLSLPMVSIQCGEDWQSPLIAFFKHRGRRMRR
ncbi:MAG: VWA domain-containing protein, partial [Nannocystaceae bacterium]|nr:VWA domain-containing protein [Nannocystaceae bacterium]